MAKKKKELTHVLMFEDWQKKFAAAGSVPEACALLEALDNNRLWCNKTTRGTSIHDQETAGRKRALEFLLTVVHVSNRYPNKIRKQAYQQLIDRCFATATSSGQHILGQVGFRRILHTKESQRLFELLLKTKEGALVNADVLQGNADVQTAAFNYFVEQPLSKARLRKLTITMLAWNHNTYAEILTRRYCNLAPNYTRIEELAHFDDDALALFKENVRSRYGKSFKSGVLHGDPVALLVITMEQRCTAYAEHLEYRTVMDERADLTRQLEDNGRRLQNIEGE